MEKVLETLKNFAKAEDIILYKSLPKITEVSEPIDMEIDAYLDVAKKLGCKIIYYFTDVFFEDLDFYEIEERRDDLDEESEVLKALNKGLAQIKRRWSKYEEELESLKVMWVYNGIGHTFTIHEDWVRELNSDIKKLLERVDELEAITPLPTYTKISNDDLKDPKVKAWYKEFEIKKDEWSKLLAENKLFNEAKNQRARSLAAAAIVPGIEDYSSSVECPGYGYASDYLFVTAEQIKKKIQQEKILELKTEGHDPKEIALLVSVALKKVKEVIAQAEYEGNPS